MDALLRNTLIQLRDVTQGCREDMHEPDNQGVRARVLGDHLDNANGNTVIPDAVVQGWQEYVVVIEQGDRRQIINLASLIALARLADMGADVIEAARLLAAEREPGLLKRRFAALDLALGKLNDTGAR